MADGNFGGGRVEFGRVVGASQWSTQSDFVAIHEVNHSIDSIFHSSNLNKYEFNHGIWAIKGGVGNDFSINAQILRNMLSANLDALDAPFDDRMIAPDADDDGLPDSSPLGLLNPLSITEAILGGMTDRADSDSDGVLDLFEAIALPDGSTNLNSSDSDGDGVLDSVDPNPAYRMNDQIVRATPNIDGIIDLSENGCHDG